eukprot:gene11790-biopygen4744
MQICGRRFPKATSELLKASPRPPEAQEQSICNHGRRTNITAPTPGLRPLRRAARSRSPRVFRSPGVGAVMYCSRRFVFAPTLWWGMIPCQLGHSLRPTGALVRGR